jgi:hypothetical protein
MNRRHYSHCGDRFSFLKSGSKPSERHSFTSVTRLGSRSAELFVGGFDLLAPCLVPSKNFRSCGSCQRRETIRGSSGLAAFCGVADSEGASAGGTYATSTLSTSVGVPRRGIRGRRSALLPATFGKTTSAGCGSDGFMAAAAIAPRPARQTTPSATVRITWHAPTRRGRRASGSNRSRMRQCYLVG